MSADDWHGTVEMIRRTNTAKGRADSGCFSIEGIRLHERALRAGIPLKRVVTSTAFIEDPSQRSQKLLAELKVKGTPVVVAPESIIEDLTGKRNLGPILGLVKMPPRPALEDILLMAAPKPVLILAAVDVQDPGNVGALLRTGHASGATAFAAVGISDPFHPKALRTSMGSLFKLPVLRFDDADELEVGLMGLGIERVGTAVTGGIPLPEATFSEKGTAIYMGSESWGLAENVQSTVDWLVSIPMVDGVDSLSVNAAAAVVLYEITRRRSLEQD